jgi:CRISPR-associated protein Csb2
MPHWLAIEVSFLAGRYHGRRRGGAEPDWPPAPHRLHQALVAAAHADRGSRPLDDAQVAALRWLEEQGAPEISAPAASESAAFVISVPNNDLNLAAKHWARGVEPPDQEAPQKLRTMKTLRPLRVGGDGTVRYLWPVADDALDAVRPHGEVLSAVVRRLHHLGLGIDLVAGNGRLLGDVEKRALPGEVWIPDPDGRGTRVPVPGSYEEIVTRYATFLRRADLRRLDPPTPPSVVGYVTYRRRSDAPARRAHAFTLTREGGGVASFDARKAIHIAAWLRHAAHEAAKRLRLDPAFVEQEVCGHGSSAEEKSHRFSYLPIPSIGHQHVDGRVRRVVIAEPPLGRGHASTPALLRALAEAPLVSEDGEVMAELRPAQGDEDPVLERYFARARTWATATPIILPGRDDRRSRRAVALIVKALAQSGCTTPVAEITVLENAPFSGVELPRSYVVPAYLRDFPRVHAVVRFSEPVPGPVAIGSGRHVGLGLMASR